MKRFYKINNATKENYIEVEVSYELGGRNMFTGQENQRGYYAYVRPITKGNGTVGFTMFEGFKQCLKPVKRQSEKARKEAVDLLDSSNVIELAKQRYSLKYDVDWETYEI